MYICKKHGKLESKWCKKCEKAIKCDCKDLKFVQLDQIIEYKEGKKKIAIQLFYCWTCGDPSYATKIVELVENLHTQKIKIVKMYKCKIHEQLKSSWCKKCKKFVFCDCNDLNLKGVQFKDQILNCKEGKKKNIIQLCYCWNCGKPFYVRIGKNIVIV